MKKKTIPMGDKTKAERQARRNALLNKAADQAGFKSWSAYETAVINGYIRVLPMERASLRDPHRRAKP